MAAQESRAVNATLSWLLDLVYPPKCAICGKLLKEDEKDACKHCMLELPVFTGEIRCGEFFEGCAAPFRYEGGLRESLLRYKFGGRQHYARFYAVYLAAAIRERFGEEYELISWVPISRRRRLERGYDQAQELAGRTALLLDKPCVRTLRKIKHNRRQSGISDPDERRGNVKNAYRAVRPDGFAGKTVLLIDDIITTGATLSECAGVLRTAGAAHVLAAVAATAARK